jgi:hypothetical protein
MGEVLDLDTHRVHSDCLKILVYSISSKSKAVPLRHAGAMGERKYSSHSFLTPVRIYQLQRSFPITVFNFLFPQPCYELNQLQPRKMLVAIF